MTDTDLQKQLALAKMTQILGNVANAKNWMSTLREEFKTPEGMWRTANEMIERGDYDKVLTLIGKIEANK